MSLSPMAMTSHSIKFDQPLPPVARFGGNSPERKVKTKPSKKAMAQSVSLKPGSLSNQKNKKKLYKELLKDESKKQIITYKKKQIEVKNDLK